MSASDEIAMSSTTSPADASIAPTTPLAKRSTRAINVTQVDRPENASQRRRRLAVAPYQTQSERRQHPGGRQRERDGDRTREARPVGDEERVLGAVLACRERGRVEERYRQRSERHQRKHEPDERPILPPQMPGRVRENQVREGHEREPAHDEAEGEQKRAV